MYKHIVPTKFPPDSTFVVTLLQFLPFRTKLKLRSSRRSTKFSRTTGSLLGMSCIFRTTFRFKSRVVASTKLFYKTIKIRTIFWLLVSLLFSHGSRVKWSAFGNGWNCHLPLQYQNSDVGLAVVPFLE